jgi:hypothetical protein
MLVRSSRHGGGAGDRAAGLALAAEVTESYISQLFTGKKLPPAPDRTDIYQKMGKFLRFSGGRLAKLAHSQRTEEMKRGLAETPTPLFAEVRDLIVRKCAADRQPQIRATFAKQSFGAFERLVTNSFSISDENCVACLEPLINSWDIDLSTFGMEIVLNQRLVPGQPKKFECVERESADPGEEEPGLVEFLQDDTLSSGITQLEIEFPRRQTFKGKRPNPLYY